MEIHLLNPGRSTNRYCGNMDGGEPMLCYIVLETNESPMLRGRGEARLEEVAGETGEDERKQKKGGRGNSCHCSIDISVVFLRAQTGRQIGPLFQFQLLLP